MNKLKNSHYRSYFERMASAAGLVAHTTQDGTTAVLSYKNMPLVLAKITPREYSEEDIAFLKEAASKIGKAFVALRASQKEMLSSIIMPEKSFDIDLELFAGVPKEVKTRICEKIEEYERGMKNNLGAKASKPKHRKLTPMKKKSAMKPSSNSEAFSNSNPLIQEYLVAS